MEELSNNKTGFQADAIADSMISTVRKVSDSMISTARKVSDGMINTVRKVSNYYKIQDPNT